MNREILFRGKSIKNDVWLFGSLVIRNSNIGLKYAIHNSQGSFLGYVKKETIGQYTGLKDKNGVKIFEGDVCYCNNEHYEIKLEENGGAYKVINIKKTSDKHFLLHTNDVLQVVYNIHDK